MILTRRSMSKQKQKEISTKYFNIFGKICIRLIQHLRNYTPDTVCAAVPKNNI